MSLPIHACVAQAWPRPGSAFHVSNRSIRTRDTRVARAQHGGVTEETPLPTPPWWAGVRQHLRQIALLHRGSHDPSLCDPSLCDPSLCDPSGCDPSGCDPSGCAHSTPVMSVRSAGAAALAAVRVAERRRTIRTRYGCSWAHLYFTHHAAFHVVQHVAVVGPAPQCIGTHTVAAACTRRHIDGVFTDLKRGVGIL